MRALLAAVLLALVAAPASVAAVRHAAPAGVAEGDCSAAAPCSAAYALEGAGSAAGDTVVLAGGTYPDQPLTIDRPLFVTAAEGARPVLRTTAPGATTLTLGPSSAGAVVERIGIRAAGDDATAVAVRSAATLQRVAVSATTGRCLLSDAVGVRVDASRFSAPGPSDVPCLEATGDDAQWTDVVVRTPNVGTAAAFHSDGEIRGATFEGLHTGLRVAGSPLVRRVTAIGALAGLEIAGGALVTDSVMVATEAGSALLASAGESHVVNVTAWGDGAGATGIRATTGATLLVRNSIARGPSGDVVADPASTTFTDQCADPAGCPAGSVAISASNFRTALRVADAGANQSENPRFADPALYDFHLLRGSPAIDAGNFELNVSGADRHGRYRWLGKAPDIGAYEFPARRAPRVPADDRPPALGIVRLTATAFRVARTGLAFSAARPPRGTTLVAVLSEDGDVVLTVTRPGSGRVLGTLVRSVVRGSSRIRLSGRLEGQPLPAGRFLLHVMGRDRSQNLSEERVLPFRVVA